MGVSGTVSHAEDEMLLMSNISIIPFNSTGEYSCIDNNGLSGIYCMIVLFLLLFIWTN